MSEQAFSRRSFVTGLAAAGALGWLYDSDALTARVVRGTFTDVQRDVPRLTAPDLSGWTDKTLDVLWVGHATVLVNLFGLHILTDPVLFDWVGAQVGIATIGRKRLVGAALDPDKLPRIDLVLLSHAHMDHMDIPSLRRISRGTQIITAPKTTDIIAGVGFKRVSELRWNEQASLTTPSGDVSVRAVEVKHWGARWRSDSYRGYVGYLIEREGKTILFGGDTAYCAAFKQLRGKNIDVAIMPIGSYGSKSGNHCTPEEAVQMSDYCAANFIVPVHHSTFPIGKEPLKEPLERLHACLSPDRIALTSPGQTWRLPA
jgi:L-ascorbate metabolism protein UlaG (beta-lactamase superfamily)